MSTRQYPCDACDYSATTSSNLSRHKAKCHPAARPASGRRVTAKRQYSPSPDNRRKCPRPPHIQLKSPDSDLIRKPFNHINRHIATTISNTVVVISSLYFVKLNIYSVINKEGVKNIWIWKYLSNIWATKIYHIFLGLWKLDIFAWVLQFQPINPFLFDIGHW